MKQATSDTPPLPLPWEARATEARIGMPPPLPPGTPERPPVSGGAHVAKPPKRGPSKITHSLVALSSAAILAVYAVGYVRTESADAQLNGGSIPTSRVIAAAPVVLSTGTIVPLPTTGSGNSGFFSPNTPTPAPAPTATFPAATPTANAVAAAVIATGTAEASPTAAATRSAAVTTTSANAPATTGATGAPTLVPFTPPRAIATAPAPAVLPATTTTLPTATHAATATTVPTVASRATTPAAAAAAKTGKYKDGSYTGTGTSRRGDIEVAVTVQGGKITSAEITTCGTVYSCSRIAALPGQVITRQSATVDRVSGATYSTQAYQLAVADALAQAGGA